MKKTKLTLGLALSAISCTLLAGCGGATYSPEGVILTYTNAAGEQINYTAEDLFDGYYDDSSKVSTMFDSIYKVIVRNYFISEEAGKKKYDEILKNAKNDVEGIKTKAKENADTNSSSYDDEWNELLESYSCEDEDELLEHFIYERELTEFNDQFYDNNTEFLRDAKPEDGYDGYINSKSPYHVRHILVKISDTANNNFYNATISKENAQKLYTVANALANGTSFGQVALTQSDDNSGDSSSATKYGDLGIMDKDTSFVNEFKLGVYAYENIYNEATKEAAKTSNVAIGTSYDAYKEAAETRVIGEGSTVTTTVTNEISTIPYGVFVKLNEVASVETDAKGENVNDGSANTFPRNVWFNNYLNLHEVSLITYDVVDGQDTSALPADTTYFQDITVNGVTKKVLVTTDGQPILAVRAGTSDYQGIHFIIVQRSPLVEEQNGVSLSNYWTTKYPGQDGYPKDSDNKNMSTYVNFLNQETKEYKTRAEEVENKIKNFDSDLNKYIYQKNLDSQKITFKDTKLQEAIDKWIEVSKNKKTFDNQISWDKTWDEYVETLKIQNTERAKLFPTTCAIGFSTHSGSEWESGGVCYDKK